MSSPKKLFLLLISLSLILCQETNKTEEPKEANKDSVEMNETHTESDTINDEKIKEKQNIYENEDFNEIEEKEDEINEEEDEENKSFNNKDILGQIMKANPKMAYLKEIREKEKEKDDIIDPFGVENPEFLNPVEDTAEENTKPSGGTVSWLDDLDNLQVPSRTFYNEKKKEEELKHNDRNDRNERNDFSMSHKISSKIKSCIKRSRSIES